MPFLILCPCCGWEKRGCWRPRKTSSRGSSRVTSSTFSSSPSRSYPDRKHRDAVPERILYPLTQHRARTDLRMFLHIVCSATCRKLLYIGVDHRVGRHRRPAVRRGRPISLGADDAEVAFCKQIYIRLAEPGCLPVGTRRRA